MRRRDLFPVLAGGALIGCTDSGVRFNEDPFQLGIASGDPTPDSVVLWTRLAPRPFDEGGGMPSQSVPVQWVVAADEQFSRVLQRGEIAALPEFAHSVHVEPRGLPPGQWLWYQFFAGSGSRRVASPVGRTRTAPPIDSDSDLRFALASCQRYEDGYYTAYSHMAEEDLDLVIHVGDYIYESAVVAGKPRPHSLPTARTLDDYRQRYALYKSDPELQKAHALFPWASVWDDHEVENDYAGLVGGAGPRDDFPAQRAAAYRAYYEHMPLRSSALPRGGQLDLHRRLRYGRLAEIFLLDTRQYRSDQPCGGDRSRPCEGFGDKNAQMLGAAQERWLFDGLTDSSAVWNILAQQVIFSRFDLDPGPGIELSMDKWDGYPAARARISTFLAERRPANPVILAGDNHNHWLFDVKRDFDRPESPVIATEFAGTSISSNGDGQEVHPTYGIALKGNPHLKFHHSRRGYVRCHASTSLWRADFRSLPYVSRPGAPIATQASFVIEPGRPGAVPA